MGVRSVTRSATELSGGRGLSYEARKGEEAARPSLFELRRALHFAAKQSLGKMGGSRWFW